MINYSYLAPPPAAHNIVHTDYYIKHHEREKGARKIYETVQYDEYEMERIKELKEEIHKLNIVLPEDWKESDYLKIGYSGRFKMKEVIKFLIQKLQLHISWRNNPIYHQINPAIEKFLQNGICYVFGRDKQYRPIVILNAHLIDLKKYDKETIIQSLSFMMGIIRKHMFIPGKVENWLFILESNGLGVFGLPVKALQVVIDTMSTNFGGCLEKMFILNPSSGLNFLWKTISGFLDPETAQKINFMQQKDFKKLLEFIDVKQLEQKYGGEQPNQQKFWPPYNLDLIDGRTVPKSQNEAIKQSIQQNGNQEDDPYDKVEFNVHDFLETQKKLYSMDYPAKPQQEEKKEEEIIQQAEPEEQAPEIVPQQQFDNNDQTDQAIQQQEEQPLKEQPAELPQIEEEPVTPRLNEAVNQVQQEEPEKQNNEENILSNASATKIPVEVQAPNVEMSKVDPVANNAACCQTCLIF